MFCHLLGGHFHQLPADQQIAQSAKHPVHKLTGPWIN